MWEHVLFFFLHSTHLLVHTYALSNPHLFKVLAHITLCLKVAPVSQPARPPSYNVSQKANITNSWPTNVTLHKEKLTLQQRPKVFHIYEVTYKNTKKSRILQTERKTTNVLCGILPRQHSRMQNLLHNFRWFDCRSALFQPFQTNILFIRSYFMEWLFVDHTSLLSVSNMRLQL